MAELGRSRMAAWGGDTGVQHHPPPPSFSHPPHPARSTPTTPGTPPYRAPPPPLRPWGGVPRAGSGIIIGVAQSWRGGAVPACPPPLPQPPRPQDTSRPPHSLLLRSETDCSAELFFSSAAFCCCRGGQQRRQWCPPSMCPPPTAGAPPVRAHLLLDLGAVGQRVLAAVVDGDVASCGTGRDGGAAPKKLMEGGGTFLAPSPPRLWGPPRRSSWERWAQLQWGPPASCCWAEVAGARNRSCWQQLSPRGTPEPQPAAPSRMRHPGVLRSPPAPPERKGNGVGYAQERDFLARAGTRCLSASPALTPGAPWGWEWGLRGSACPWKDPPTPPHHDRASPK